MSPVPHKQDGASPDVAASPQLAEAANAQASAPTHNTVAVAMVATPSFLADALGTQTSGQTSVAGEGVKAMGTRTSVSKADEKVGSARPQTTLAGPGAKGTSSPDARDGQYGNSKSASSSAGSGDVGVTKAAASVSGDGTGLSTTSTPVAFSAAPVAGAPTNTVARASEGVAHDTAGGDAPPAASSSPINVARVVESIHGSEMRVGVRTEEFGNVSVSTAVNREQIAAQISFDHGDLGRLLAAHLPSMQEKLGSDTGLHATVQVLDRGASYSQGGQSGQGGDSGQAPQAGSQSGAGGQSQRSLAYAIPAPSSARGSTIEAVSGERSIATAAASRLDVRA